MTKLEKFESNLEVKYKELLDKYQIDKQTGELKHPSYVHHNFKFPTYPYIGSSYGNGKGKKILFIGLDIGKDEKQGIQSFEERRQAIECKALGEHNPHIAGTGITALYFLKDELGWGQVWEKVKTASHFKKALEKGEHDLRDENPLSYVALTNYYKWVTKDRENRRGNEDRIELDRCFDRKFFISEVEVFKPDIVIFQSDNKKEFKSKMDMVNSLTPLCIMIGPHPSWPRSRQPEYFVNQIKGVASETPD